MSEAQEAQAQSPILKQTIKLSQLTLGDWLAISASKDNSPQWGFYGWLNSYDKLTELRIEDWEAIADELGYSGAWAYKQYSEHRA